jgi:signal transduction histidine kinase
MLVFTPADREWLARRAAGDAAAPAFRRLDDGMIAHAAILADGATVVAMLAEQRITNEIVEILRTDPPLAALAEAYGRRYGRSISAGRDAIVIDVPWGGSLRIDSSPAFHQGSALLVYLPALAFLACALGLAVAGFVFLYRTARRDLRLAQLKSDFVSNVSHEMKTPLSLVRMFGEMLSLGYERDEEERRRYHQLIVQESQRLGLLVDNVLDFAAIEKGRRRFDRAELDLSEVADEVLAAYREQLTAEGFALELELQRPGPRVSADRDALKQVLLNLLSNAMKYSREERRVAVSVRREGGEAVLAVADRGIGIDPAEHQRIFEQFYRVESGLTRETRGAGLGLSLVRSIVEAHGGRVSVDSTPGKGSVFSVRLPLSGAESA